jgi:hypothetical protein
MGPGNVYSVEETPEVISNKLEEMETLRIRNALLSSDILPKKG